MTYNGEEIENIYPPVAFYIVGQIQQIFGWELIEIFRWYPLVMSIAAIFIVHDFCRYYFEDDQEALIATALFALMPVTIISSIGGGGVVRATGAFFALTSIYMGYRLIIDQNRWLVLPVGLFLALASLTQPQSGIFAYASLIIFVAMRDLSLKTLLKIIIAGAIALIFILGWILFIQQSHGTFSPITLAFFNQLNTDPFEKVLDTFTRENDPGLAREALIRVLSAFWLIGVFVCISLGRNEIVLWLTVIILIPITTSANVVLPLAMVLAVTINYIIITGLSSFRVSKRYDPTTGKMVSHSNNWAIYIGYTLTGLIMVTNIINIVYARDIDNFSLGTIDEDNYEAMEWVEEKTPAGSIFYVVTGSTSWDADEVSDWFPVLAKRTSYATVRGTEWIDDIKFNTHIERYRALQACMGRAPICLDGESLRIEADTADVYVYLTAEARGRLRPNLLNNPNYTLVYPTRLRQGLESVLIFQRNN
jgi:hypothetical protein